MPDRFRSRNSAIDDEAIDWLVRLGGRPSADERQAFSQWCARSPAHRQAWQQAQGLLQAVADTRLAREHQQMVQVLATSPARGISRRGLLLGGASAAALAGVGVLGLGGAALADQRTAPGQRLQLALPDGSRAWLNTASAVSMQFGAQQRQVALDTGELFVEVAAGGVLPFTVNARDGQLRSRDARFSLHQHGGHSVLTVVAGVVELSAIAGTMALAANQRLLFNKGMLGLRENLDADAATAWTRGKLIFNQQPLQDIALELERYLRGRVVIVGDRLQQLRLSGVFALDDLPALLRAVAALAGAELVNLPLLHVIR
ncbi:FecR family protein [Stenotrophomonas sp. UBA7606]|uniref:FecR family protein n=1 Tax=Stenotrophomonas sp. UBA7606 TaxID=1947559 RepID=UPI0025F375F6|nr:FecR domain-containing protein [Stenotrophomonas sp. UBA7606]